MIVIMTIFIRESMKIVIMKAAGALWPYLNALSQWFSWQNWCSCYISLKVKLDFYLKIYLYLYLCLYFHLYLNALSQWCHVAKVVQLAHFTQVKLCLSSSSYPTSCHKKSKISTYSSKRYQTFNCGI